MGGGNDDSALKEKMESLKEELQDKIEELEVYQDTYSYKDHLERESRAKDEVNEARKELIQVIYIMNKFPHLKNAKL